MRTHSLSLTLLLGSLASCSTMHENRHTADINAEDYGRLPASECDSSLYKDCKMARKSGLADVADVYMLGHEGTLYRKVGNLTCTVTTNVESFKVSNHLQDQAVVYYLKKDRELRMIYAEMVQRPLKRGQCPSTGTKFVMADVVKYELNSNPRSPIVNAALSANGDFKAWTNELLAYQESNVKDYALNSCHGVKDKQFSYYALFIQQKSGFVTKVKVAAESKYMEHDAKVTAQSYGSLADFKNAEHVCEK